MEIVDSNNYLKLTLINDENEFEHEVKVEFRNAISQFGKSIYFERIELDGLNEAFETKFIKRYTIYNAIF